jgi:hypothetical protein
MAIATMPAPEPPAALPVAKLASALEHVHSHTSNPASAK